MKCKALLTMHSIALSARPFACLTGCVRIEAPAERKRDTSDRDDGEQRAYHPSDSERELSLPGERTWREKKLGSIYPF